MAWFFPLNSNRIALLAQSSSGPDFSVSDLFSEGYLYPVLALLAISLIIVGVLSAWRSEDLAGLRKAEMKREIILELRRQMVGMTGDALSRAIGLEPFKTVKLLEELQRDNVLISHTNTQRLTLWRLKGLPPGPAKRFG